MASILKDVDLEFSLIRKEQARLSRFRDLKEGESDYKGSPLAPIIIEAKIVCFICKMAEEVCKGQSSPVLNGLYSETSIDFVEDDKFHIHCDVTKLASHFPTYKKLHYFR
jgi:hypothetical protein